MHRSWPNESFVLFQKLFGETTLVKSKQVIMALKEKAVKFVRGNATTLLHKVSNQLFLESFFRFFFFFPSLLVASDISEFKNEEGAGMLGIWSIRVMR